METELKTKLTELGLTEDQIAKLEEQGVKAAADMGKLSEQEIRDTTGCTLIAAKDIFAAFAPAPEATSDPAAIQTVLPALPDEPSFIELLKVGGILKIDRTNFISAVRAAIADKVGLFVLPDKLLARMEQFAIEQDEPLGDVFYDLQKQLARRDYGEILSALGTNGTFVSQKRKNETLSRLNSLLWQELARFNEQLRTWIETWSQGAASPAVMAMAMMRTSGSPGVMPPGILQPPPTDALRDDGEAVVNTINKVFAGAGIPVSRALAYDATKTRGILENPNLPSAVGAANRDQMLKMLGVEVGADYVRLERNVAQFALAIVELPTVPAGNEEFTYLTAMWQLGSQIPWDKLVTGTSPTVASSRAGRGTARVRGDDDGMEC